MLFLHADLIHTTTVAIRNKLNPNQRQYFIYFTLQRCTATSIINKDIKSDVNPMNIVYLPFKTI